jgi:hypothetical protein
VCSMPRLTHSILVEVASLEVECNDHFASDHPRPLSILCCEDCGEIHIREGASQKKKGGSVEGRITEDNNGLVFLGFPIRHDSGGLVVVNFGIICKL